MLFRSEAAVTKFIADKRVTGAVKLNLSVNARVGLVQAAKPGDHEALLKVLDAIIAETSPDLKELADVKQFRAQVAEAAALAKARGK